MVCKSGLLAGAAVVVALSVAQAEAAPMQTTVTGTVASQAGQLHDDQDNLALFPSLVDSSGNFVGVGTSFAFNFIWDSEITADYYYDMPASPGVPAVSGISSDALAPSSVVQDASVTIDGQTLNFGGAPSFFTINQYVHDNSQEYLFRLDNNFDPGSMIYFKGAGIAPMPGSIFEPFSADAIIQGFPSYGTIHIVQDGTTTDFGFDIASIAVSLLNDLGGGSTDPETGSGPGGGPVVVLDPPSDPAPADVPVPAAFPLLASAVAGAFALGRKRRKPVSA